MNKVYWNNIADELDAILWDFAEAIEQAEKEKDWKLLLKKAGEADARGKKFVDRLRKHEGMLGE